MWQNTKKESFFSILEITVIEKIGNLNVRVSVMTMDSALVLQL